PICLITHKGKNVNIILKTFMDILKRIVPPIQ
ncbi:LuxR family transcriptional regulator, partial [Acinetobacter bereziniae]|nr:LuxR family transcriptional regulator [Acinetobacter bereziniae]